MWKWANMINVTFGYLWGKYTEGNNKDVGRNRYVIKINVRNIFNSNVVMWLTDNRAARQVSGNTRCEYQ